MCTSAATASRIWRSFKTREGAELFLAQAMVRKAQAQPEPATRSIKLATFASEWLTDHKVHVGEQTYVNYESVLRVHILPTLGHLELRQLDRKTLDSFVSDWATGGPMFQGRAERARERENQRALEQDRPVRHVRVGRSPKTISNGIVVLCAMLGRAVEWGYLSVNPAANLRRPRDDRQASDQMHALDAVEVRALIDAAGELVDGTLEVVERQRRAQFAQTLVMTAVMTGMRRGELLAVTWGDVDWLRNRLHVRRSIGLGGRVTKPKSARSVRAIAMTPTLAAELKRHRLAARWSEEDDLIFPSSHRTPLDGRNMVREVFDPAVRRAKLPRMRFHDLRHTFASLLIAQGAHPKYISEQLGHASVQITMDRYSHLMDQSYSDESDKLEAALFGPETASGLQAAGVQSVPPRSGSLRSLDAKTAQPSRVRGTVRQPVEG